ncbi:hypothetical protein P4S72_16935 [Vibrio sp. PP-XX7]
MHSLFLRLSTLVVSAALGLSIAQAETLPTEPITPKVLVVTMFGGEAKPWQEHLNFSHAYQFQWLSEAYPGFYSVMSKACALRPPQWDMRMPPVP